MAVEKLLFEIPVYRTTRERHAQERTRSIEAEVSRVWLSGVPRQGEAFERMRNRLADEIGAWRCGQIVGWIQVIALGEQLRGDYWWTVAKRMTVRSRGHRLDYWGKAFELYVPHHSSTEEIRGDLKAALIRIQKESPFRRRYVDLQAFESISPFVNWRALFDDRPSWA